MAKLSEPCCCCSGIHSRFVRLCCFNVTALTLLGGYPVPQASLSLRVLVLAAETLDCWVASLVKGLQWKKSLHWT